MKTTSIILAAGKGTRMLSDTPKVLHEYKGRTFVRAVCDEALLCSDEVIAVVGYRGEEVVAALPSGVKAVFQAEQLGTGDAVRVALAALSPDTTTVLVMPADNPQLEAATLWGLLSAHHANSHPVTFTTAQLPDYEDWRAPFIGYGRVVRDGEGAVERIVELKDATEVERAITEVNVGVYAFDAAWLKQNIGQLSTNNKAGEFYITDLIAVSILSGEGVFAFPLLDVRQGLGVNSLEDLVTLVELHQ